MKILVAIDVHETRTKPAARAAIRFAQDVVQKTSGSFSIALVGNRINEAVAAVNGFGAEAIYLLDDPQLAGHLAQPTTTALVHLQRQHNFNLLVAPDSTTARDYLPRLAGVLSAGMCRGVCEAVTRPEGLCYKRNVFSGMVTRWERITSPLQIVSVEATAVGEPRKGTDAEAIPLKLNLPSDARTTFIETRRAHSQRPDLAVAECVVGAGRGIKSAEAMSKVEELTDKLGAALGATRAVVDAGWMPNEYQIGQTGKSIAPKLYLAIGISGAVQHVAGIRAARTIVAVNKDAEAPLLRVADIAVIGDLGKIVPRMLELL